MRVNRRDQKPVGADGPYIFYGFCALKKTPEGRAVSPLRRGRRRSRNSRVGGGRSSPSGIPREISGADGKRRMCRVGISLAPAVRSRREKNCPLKKFARNARGRRDFFSQTSISFSSLFLCLSSHRKVLFFSFAMTHSGIRNINLAFFDNLFLFFQIIKRAMGRERQAKVDVKCKGAPISSENRVRARFSVDIIFATYIYAYFLIAISTIAKIATARHTPVNLIKMKISTTTRRVYTWRVRY